MNYPLYLFDVRFFFVCFFFIIEYGDVLYHSQPGDDEEHVDISHIGNVNDL